MATMHTAFVHKLAVLVFLLVLLPCLLANLLFSFSVFFCSFCLNLSEARLSFAKFNSYTMSFCYTSLNSTLRGKLLSEIFVRYFCGKFLMITSLNYTASSYGILTFGSTCINGRKLLIVLILAIQSLSDRCSGSLAFSCKYSRVAYDVFSGRLSRVKAHITIIKWS